MKYVYTYNLHIFSLFLAYNMYMNVRLQFLRFCINVVHFLYSQKKITSKRLKKGNLKDLGPSFDP